MNKTLVSIENMKTVYATSKEQPNTMDLSRGRKVHYAVSSKKGTTTLCGNFIVVNETHPFDNLIEKKLCKVCKKLIK